MRKYLIALVALAMVLGLSGMAVAGAGSLEGGATVSGTATVSAHVNKYCSVDLTTPGTLTFTGTIDEEKSTPADATNGDIAKDCNCDTNLTAAVTTPLTNAETGAQIATKVDIDGGTWSPINGSVTVNNPYVYGVPNPVHHSLSLHGKLGSTISSQPAGDYSGLITVTIAAGLL